MPPKDPLNGLDSRLHLQPKQRLELLEELRSDLEDLEEALSRKGYRPRRAREKALRQLLPSADVVQALETHHEGTALRWIRRHSRTSNVGRWALAALAGVSVLLALNFLRQAGLFSSAGPFVGLELLLTGSLAANWAYTGFQLWVGRGVRPESRQLRWRYHAGLIVAAVAIGALGSAWEGYSVLGILGESTPEPAIAWAALRRALVLITLGTAAATFGLFAWLSFVPKLATDEAIERRIAALFRHPRSVSHLNVS